MAFGGDSEQTKLLMLKIEAILGDDADALDRNAAGSMMRAAATMLLRSIINKTAAMLLQRMDTEPPSTRHNRQRQGVLAQQIGHMMETKPTDPPIPTQYLHCAPLLAPA
jgi:hypothetical protein